MRFGRPFAFSFPTMTVITLTTSAPGYQLCQEMMKPHYRRGSRKGGRHGGGGIAECAERSEDAEGGFSGLRGFSGVSDSVDAQIDGLVCELYGLTEEELGWWRGV
jgi:hypothetical protein